MGLGNHRQCWANNLWDILSFLVVNLVLGKSAWVMALRETSSGWPAEKEIRSQGMRLVCVLALMEAFLDLQIRLQMQPLWFHGYSVLSWPHSKLVRWKLKAENEDNSPIKCVDAEVESLGQLSAQLMSKPDWKCWSAAVKPIWCVLWVSEWCVLCVGPCVHVWIVVCHGTADKKLALS